MTLTLLTAAVGASIHMATDALKMNIFCIFGAIGCLFLLYMTPVAHSNETRRLIYLLGFAFLGGMTSGQFAVIVLHIQASVISTAFFSAAIIFACFTLMAFYASDRKRLYFGGTLLSLACTMLWMKIFNAVFGSLFLLQLNLYTGLAFMCAFVLYDTQSIMEQSHAGDVDHVWHPVRLLLSFLAIIRRLTVMTLFRSSTKIKEPPPSDTNDQIDKNEINQLLAEVKENMKEKASEIVTSVKGEVEALNDKVKELQQETMELQKMAKVTVDKMDALQQQQFRSKGIL